MSDCFCEICSFVARNTLQHWGGGVHQLSKSFGIAGCEAAQGAECAHAIWKLIESRLGQAKAYIKSDMRSNRYDTQSFECNWLCKALGSSDIALWKPWGMALGHDEFSQVHHVPRLVFFVVANNDSDRKPAIGRNVGPSISGNPFVEKGRPSGTKIVAPF